MVIIPKKNTIWARMEVIIGINCAVLDLTAEKREITGHRLPRPVFPPLTQSSMQWTARKSPTKA